MGVMYRLLRSRKVAAGFALPTIVISSVILFAVLVATMSVASSAKTALDNQYWGSLARDAAESGTVYAQSCLNANNGSSSWGSNRLYPGSGCSGGTTCTLATSCPLVTTGLYTMSYSVDPVTDNGSGVITAKVTGTVALLRGSSGAIWKTQTWVTYVAVGGQVSANKIVFGYTGISTGGAFFGVVGADGKMRTAGYNADGQLGNGTTSTTTTSTLFLVPTSSPVIAGFSNFLSVGYDMFALTADGDLFGAGANQNGQLGTGTVATTSPTPARVLVPSGVKVRAATAANGVNYFIGTNNNVYSAGTCDYGLLGSNYTISGCSDASTPVRVNLPTPNVADANTIPTDNIVSDRYNTYIRMAGGRVYGWGAGDRGQLGNDAFTASSNPTKIGTFGDTSATKAVQIAYDGETLSILDDAGKVYGVGGNVDGTMGSVSTMVRLPHSTETTTCLQAASTSVSSVTCNSSTTSQIWQYRSDSTMYNAALNVCLQGSGTTLSMAACSTATTQKWTYQPSSSAFQAPLKNNSSGYCINNVSGSSSVTLATSCNGSNPQYVQFYNSQPSQFNIAGTAVKLATDQWSLSVMTSTGEVWSAGLNTSGKFGNGTTSYAQFSPVKFALPSGVKAVDLYDTGGSPIYRQNLMVVGSDGKVYGAGSNDYGQLGNGTTTTTGVSTPVTMSVIDGSTIVAKSVMVGFGTVVVLTADGGVYTVGNNSNGQLGDGTTTNRSIPVRAKYTNAFGSTIY